MKSWFKVQNKTETSIDVSIHDEIGMWGISAKDFADEVKSYGDIAEINVSIHSGGGSAFDGFAIYNYLKTHKATVNTSVLGVAASAASVILMAGDNISMPEDAFIMIHQPWTVVVGDAEEMRETADFLDKMNDTIVSIYQKKTGMDDSEIRELVADETWLNGTDALDKGFVDSLTSEKAAAMSKEMIRHFKNPPANEQAEELDFKNLKEFGSWLCKTAGISKSEKEQVIFAVKKLFQSNSDSNEEAEFDASAFDSFINTLKLR